MTLFDAVKDAVTARAAAERYGISVNAHGMAICPFHEDRHPSMKVDRRFHCFGCQEDGSVIDLVMKLFGLSARDAALKIAEDFGVAYDGWSRASPRARPVQRRISDAERLRRAEQRCVRAYGGYLALLKRWRVEYAPKSEGEEWHPLFAEALERQTAVEYILDTLATGTASERAEVLIRHGREVSDIERRVAGFADGAA